jgi:hypothetical protein
MTTNRRLETHPRQWTYETTTLQLYSDHLFGRFVNDWLVVLLMFGSYQG